MKNNRKIMVFAAALAAWLSHSTVLAQSPHRGAGATPIEVSSLPHPGTNVRWGRAEAVVDAPLDDVMKVLVDYASYSEFIPNFRSAKVLSRRGDNALVFMRASLAKNTLKLWAQLKLRATTKNGTRIIEGRMTDGNMEQMQARWEATPLPSGQTRVVFQLIMDPDVPMMPAMFINNETQKATKKTLRALRKMMAARV